MDSRIKTSLKEIEKLIKDAIFDAQNGHLTFKSNEGPDVVADLQSFVDAQGFLKDGLQVDDIVDNLTTAENKRPLSAAQGKVLKGFIDQINALLSSDETTLDDLQEIVDYIQQNKSDLQNLSVSNIAGLANALNGKYDKTGGIISGNVGIGIAPTQALDVNGYARIRNFMPGIFPFVTVEPSGILHTMSAETAARYLSPHQNAVTQESGNCGPWTAAATVILTAKAAAVNNDATGLQAMDTIKLVAKSTTQITFAKDVYDVESAKTSKVFMGTTEIIWDGTNWYKIN